MLHILTIAVREIMNVCTGNLKQMPNIDFQQDYSLKKSEFEVYYLRLPSFCFLEEKPRDFICATGKRRFYSNFSIIKIKKFE